MIGSIRRRLARPIRAQARAAQNERRWAHALASYSRARMLIGDSPPLLLQIANMQAELGLFEEAHTTLSLVAKSPDFALRGTVNLAGLAERRQIWSEAVDLWEATLALMVAQEKLETHEDWPITPAVAVLHSALCREMVGDGSGAERDLALAMILDADVRHSREAILMRARILQRGRPADAYRLLSDGHRRHPEDTTIHYHLIRLGLTTGHREEAILHARRFLDDVPEDPGLLALLKDQNIRLQLDQAEV